MVLVGVAYKYIRFIFKKQFVDTQQWVSFSELKLFDGLDGTGSEISIGAVATAQTYINNNYTPSMALDNNRSTCYESASTPFASGATSWFQLELATPSIVRSYWMHPADYNTEFLKEFPKVFDIVGSNDGTTWKKIFENKSVPGNVAAAYTRTISSYVGGRSRLENDLPSNRVLVLKWATGELLDTITPNLDGTWFSNVDYGTDVMVIHTGHAGYEPKVDGPITPFHW